ncbi:MAG: hypothetical protein EOP77_04325 [Variovorax sp.]|nr:MAG: hypothetical protein EOP77_04325 [Variovorax sp.]
MASTVVLIMRMDSVLLFESLARCTAIWVADTPANTALKDPLSAEKSGLSITWFPMHPGEQLETAAVRIAFSLDDHFNEDAQLEGYRSLLVFGAQYESSMASELAVLGFKHVEPTTFGFIAAK